MSHLYQSKFLTSGLEVKIRSRTWEEYDRFETKRLADMENLISLGGVALEIGRQKLVHGMRTDFLGLCVEDFDFLKGHISLRDVDEIEEAVLALEKREVPLGNSDAGGAGPSTPGGQNTA